MIAQGITKTLRSAWGRSFGVLMTPEWAGRAATPIHAPALSLFGVSTAEEFYGALEGGDVINGVLNRFLVLRSDGKPADRDPEQDPSVIPGDLSRALTALFTGTSDLASVRLNDSTAEIEPEIVDWATPEAKSVFDGIHTLIEERVTAQQDLEPFVARTAEIALRLATIRAIGRTPEMPLISADDMAWGRDLALRSAGAMSGDAKLYIAETERQQWSNRVLRLIAKRGVASARDIQQMLKGALRSADIKDIMATLVEAEAVEKIEVSDPAKGTAKRVLYRFKPQAA